MATALTGGLHGKLATMPKYVVESYEWQVLHDGVMSDGVVGQGGAPESIYLHVLELPEETMQKLVPRVDVHGNRESDRLALPRNEEWWIPIEGRKSWPKTVNPKVTAGCRMGEDGIPRAQPLTDAQIAKLKKAGAKLPT